MRDKRSRFRDANEVLQIVDALLDHELHQFVDETHQRGRRVKGRGAHCYYAQACRSRN